MRRVNKVVRVSFSGGILGLIFGSTRGKLEAVISEHNREGWSVAEVVPDNPNLAIWLLRFVFLIVTLGLWTLSSGYLLILERPAGEGSGSSRGPAPRMKEPVLSASRK